MKLDPQEFIDAARSMLGTKFKHQGRHPKFGLDCAGLAVCSARKCGYPVVDFVAYDRMPLESDFLATLRRNCVEVPPGQERRGDLWLFKFNGNSQHVAIQTEENPPTMIHAAITHRAVVEHAIDETWRARRAAVFRPKED